MHNRARLVAGAFLTKHLDRLARGRRALLRSIWSTATSRTTPATGSGSRGTGTDTRPNRRLSPERQARRFDPEGVYVRRYVPELGTPDYRSRGASRHERGWETNERVLESGGFESRQRVLVAERPVVEASESGARWLGVDLLAGGRPLHARRRARELARPSGGRLRLLGGATLLTFGPPELAIRRRARLLPVRDRGRAARAAGRRLGHARAASREGAEHELSVTVEEYLPRLAARAGAPWWTGALYAKGQSPFHAAVSRRYFELLVRERAVKVAVFGATGVIGQALLPLLAGEHDVVAVSRGPRDEPSGVRWVEADVASGEGVPAALEGADVAYYLVHSLGARDFERQDREAAANVAREAASAGVQQIVYLGGLGGDDPDASAHLRSRRETGERLAAGRRAGDDAARRDGRRQGQRRLRDDPRPREAAAGDDHAELGLDADAADRARRRRALSRRSRRQRRGASARPSTPAGRR